MSLNYFNSVTVVCCALHDLVQISLHAHVEKSLSSIVISRAVEQVNAPAAVCSSSFVWHWDNRQHLLAAWILNCVSIWMVWSSFQNTVSKGPICYPHPHIPHPNTHVSSHTLPTAAIMASHVAGPAVMKCEASVTPQGSYCVELYSLF